MFKDIENNKTMLRGAYRKLKSYYYYNKNFLFMRKKIAEFEKDHELMDRIFSDLANCLRHPYSQKTKTLYSNLLQKIDFYVIPKKFDSNICSVCAPVSNTIPRDKKMKTVNFFINAPISIFILDTVWTIFLAQMDNDKHLLSHDVYGNTINMSSLFFDDKANFENQIMFNRYFNKYSDWRNNAFRSLEKNYDQQKDSLLISLDIASYFYSVVFDFNKFGTYFNNHELLETIKPLSLFLKKVYEMYFESIKPYRKDLIYFKRNQYPLPIGLFSSMILGNIYLTNFDKTIHAQTDVSYYGRYVDDMLLVVKKTITPEETNADILKSVLVDTGIFSIQESKYKIVNFPGLFVQAEKIKILYIDHSESRAIIDIYNDTIRIIPSQMEPIPESNLTLNSFDETAYSVENFTKEHKVRDIGLIGVDAFKVSRFFTALAHRYAHINTMAIDIAIEIDKYIIQIEKFFTGSQGVEFYSNWLNYMYFLVITQRWKQLRRFITDTKKRIAVLNSLSLDKKIYNKVATINKKAKDDLQQHLDICLSLALSLDIDIVNHHFKSYKESVVAYIDSNMFDHTLIAFPLSNYLEYANDVSLIKMDLKDIGTYPESIEKSYKFIWSPRFIHYDELLLLLFYHYHKDRKNELEFDYVKSGLIAKFMAINHMDYKPFTFTSRKIDFLDNYILRNIIIPSNEKSTPSNVNVAVGSLNISLKKCLNGCKRWDNISLQEKEVIYGILRDSYRCFDIKNKNPMILVLPELCFPIYWIGELVRFAKMSQIAVIAGLQYLGDENGQMYNYVATILPFTTGKKKYKNACIFIREKNDYSPIEFEELAKKGLFCKDRNTAEYHLYSWKGINLAPIVCYELTDVTVRAILKGRCDIIAASVFNPDTTYFSNIIDSTARDLHTFIVQANTSFLGDSRVTGPYDRDSKDVFKIKGGDNDHVVIGSVEFKKLKDFQSSYYKKFQEKLDTIGKQRLHKNPQYPKKSKTKPDIKPLSARFKKY